MVDRLGTPDRSRLAVTLDFDDHAVALRVAGQVVPYFGIARVPLTLWVAAGPTIFGSLVDLGYRVLMDDQLWSHPEEVARTAALRASLGVQLQTFHAAGGSDMLERGVRAFLDAESQTGAEEREAIGVFALPDDPFIEDGVVVNRCRMLVESGCARLMCSLRQMAILDRLEIATPRLIVDDVEEVDRGGRQGDLVALGRFVSAPGDLGERAASAVSGFHGATG